MFQEIFAHQPASLFFWPILAMVLFVGAFSAVMVRVVLTSAREINDEAALQLFEEERPSKERR
jgi:hypothetical protein